MRYIVWALAVMAILTFASISGWIGCKNRVVDKRPVVFKETPLPLPTRDSATLNDIVLKSKWQVGIPLHTTVSEGRYNPHVTYDDLAKLKKELLSAIEKHKCNHEIIIIEQPDDGFHNMPHYPDRTDPRFDTNAYKILLHSEN